MYKVEVDLNLVYIPPMNEKGSGILITKTFELPFVPSEGLSVYSRQWDDCPEPHGIALKEIVWDMDRQLFLATAYHIHQDFPISFLPAELREWVRRGWRLGSYKDFYADGEDEDMTAVPAPQDVPDEEPRDELAPELLELLHTLPPKKRPAEFNTFFKALIRQLSMTYNNQAAAYAMDKTGCYLGEGRVQSDDKPAIQKWREQHDAFGRMPFEEQYKWMRKIEKYPDLPTAVLRPATAAKSDRKPAVTIPGP